MRYEGSITVTAGTAAKSFATTKVRVCKGTLTRVTVLYPPGSGGLVFTSVWYGGHQIQPTNPDGFFIGGDHLHVIECSLPVDQPPFEFDIHGWAPASTLSHTVYFGFEINRTYTPQIAEPIEVALPEGFER